MFIQTVTNGTRKSGKSSAFRYECTPGSCSSVSKLVQLYTTAAARCTLITKGTAFPAFSGAIRDSLDKHLDRYLF